MSLASYQTAPPRVGISLSGMHCRPVLYRPLSGSSRAADGEFLNSVCVYGFQRLRVTTEEKKELPRSERQSCRRSRSCKGRRVAVIPFSAALSDVVLPLSFALLFFRHSAIRRRLFHLPPPGIRRSRIPLTNWDDWAVPSALGQLERFVEDDARAAYRCRAARTPPAGAHCDRWGPFA